MEEPKVIDRWLPVIKCPSCSRTELKYNNAANHIICNECGWSSFATINYADLLNTENKYEELATNYAELFTKLDQGKLGDLQRYYSKTIDEEFNEFLAETMVSVEQLKGMQVLDAGCGIARLTERLCSEGADCVALDIHPRLYTYAQKSLDKPDANLSPLYIRGSVERIPFEACFDMVWCQGVLSYVPNPAQAIKELIFVTRPGGYVYFCVNSSTRTNIIYKLARAIRRFPRLIREPLYDLMALAWDNAVAIVQRIRGKGGVRKRQTRLHLRDYSIAEKIRVLSLDDVLRLFDDRQWEIVRVNDRGGTICCLAKKLK